MRLDLRFAGLGGATETAVHNTIFEIGELSDLPADWTALPYGTPLPNMPAEWSTTGAATAPIGLSASCGCQDAASRGAIADDPTSPPNASSCTTAGCGTAQAIW